MLTILWYIITAGLSIFGAGWLMNYFPWLISESSPPPEFEKFSQWFLETEQWYMSSIFETKLLIAGGMTLLAILLAVSCRLDTYLRNLPGGSFLDLKIGESPFDEHWTFRLLPCMIFFTYIFIRIIAMIFFPQAQFEIQSFSLMGQGYTTAQWITHVTYFLMLASMIFLIFDSFLSAGPIGSVLHIIAVLAANITGLLLSFAIIITLLQAVTVAAAIIVVTCVVIGLFTAAYRAIYMFV